MCFLLARLPTIFLVMPFALGRSYNTDIRPSRGFSEILCDFFLFAFSAL